MLGHVASMPVQLEVHFGDVGRPAAVFLEPWSRNATRLEVQQYSESSPGEACWRGHDVVIL